MMRRLPHALGCSSLVSLLAAYGCGGDSSNLPLDSQHDSGAGMFDGGGNTPDGGDSASPGDAGSMPLDSGVDASDSGAPLPLSRWSVGGTVNALLHANGAYYVGGSFARISRHGAFNLLALDASGAPTACNVGTGFDAGLSAVAQSGNAIYAAGAFTHYQGQLANRIAKIDATTCALDTTFSPPANNGFSGLVTSLAVSGTSLYVGGQFATYRSASANRIAKLDAITGDLDTTFSPPANNGPDNNVNAVAVSGNAVFIGGSFSAYRGVAGSASRIAKLDATTGAIDTTFSPPASNGFNDAVLSLAATPTAVYVGGFFATYRGTGSASRLAKLDVATGALDTTFSPPANNGVNDIVFAIAPTATSLYVGGRFTSYRGTTATRIAKLDLATGALDTSFTPPAASDGFTGVNTVQVVSIVPSGNALYVGGGFTSYRGVSNSAMGLAKLDATTGAQDATFMPPDSNIGGIAGSVTDTVIVNGATMQGSTLWIGGRFTVYGGYAVSNLARLDDTTLAIDTTFSPVAANGFDGAVNALVASGASVIAGGAFTSYRGAANSALRIAKLDASTGVIDTTFSPPGAGSNGFGSTVRALATNGSDIYAGGDFTVYRGTSPALRVAKLDATTGALDTTFSPAVGPQGLDNSVRAIAVGNGALYIGGSFVSSATQPTALNRIAKIHLATAAVDGTFTPAMNAGFDAPVNALAVSGNALFVGGEFLAYRGVADSAHRIAKLDATSGVQDATFGAASATNGFDGNVDALALDGASLWVGGAFTAHRGVVDSAHRVAKLDAASGALDPAFGPATDVNNGFDGALSALLVNGGIVLTGGAFAAYRGAITTPRRGLLFVSGTTGERR